MPEPKRGVANDDDDQHNNVAPLRLLEAPIEPASEPPTNPQLSALEKKLLAMTHDELLQLAEAFDVGK